MTPLSFLLDDVSLRHIHDSLHLEKIFAFPWATVEQCWTSTQEKYSCFLFAVTFSSSHFYSLLKQYLFSLSFLYPVSVQLIRQHRQGLQKYICLENMIM